MLRIHILLLLLAKLVSRKTSDGDDISDDAGMDTFFQAVSSPRTLVALRTHVSQDQRSARVPVLRRWACDVRYNST